MRNETRTGLLVAFAIVVASCGGSPADGGSTVAASLPTTTAASGTTSPPATTTAPTSTTTNPPTTTTTPVAATTTTSATVTTTTVAGEPVDLGPVAGDVLAVVGVRYDDNLNVRAGPGVGYDVLARLAPTADDLVAKGNTWSIPGAFWIEIEAGGVTGWVNLRYVAYLADTTDVTASVVDLLGEIPDAETMLDLGTMVAEALIDAGDSDVSAEAVVSVAPTVGDLGEITLDLTGAGDDSVYGVRLHIFGQPSASGEGFVLKSIEGTALCARGVSGGVCI